MAAGKQLCTIRMKKIILFGILALMLVGIASSQIDIAPLSNPKLILIKPKLQTYANNNFKENLKYSSIDFKSYEIRDGIVKIILNIDGKEVRWLTSEKNFREITK